MIRAIGLVEFNSIAKGIEAADQMLKMSNVEIVISSPTCPGKYITLIHGDVAAVENSVKAGKSAGGQFVVADIVIPNIDPQIFPAITGSSLVEKIDAIGVIESFSIASLIIAADACVKAAGITLLEIRLGQAIGGKSVVVFTGDVADVNSAMEAGTAVIEESGNLVAKIVIPSPHSDLKKILI